MFFFLSNEEKTSWGEKYSSSKYKQQFGLLGCATFMRNIACLILINFPVRKHFWQSCKVPFMFIYLLQNSHLIRRPLLGVPLFCYKPGVYLFLRSLEYASNCSLEKKTLELTFLASFGWYSSSFFYLWCSGVFIFMSATFWSSLRTLIFPFAEVELVLVCETL